MQLPKASLCPLLDRECETTKCIFFTQIAGKNPNTGEDINEWGCAIAWLPVLLIDNAKETRQSAAAVESFRNESVKAHKENVELHIATTNFIADNLRHNVDNITFQLPKQIKSITDKS